MMDITVIMNYRYNGYKGYKRYNGYNRYKGYNGYNVLCPPISYSYYISYYISYYFSSIILGWVTEYQKN